MSLKDDVALFIADWKNDTEVLPGVDLVVSASTGTTFNRLTQPVDEPSALALRAGPNQAGDAYVGVDRHAPLLSTEKSNARAWELIYLHRRHNYNAPANAPAYIGTCATQWP